MDERLIGGTSVRKCALCQTSGVSASSADDTTVQIGTLRRGSQRLTGIGRGWPSSDVGDETIQTLARMIICLLTSIVYTPYSYRPKRVSRTIYFVSFKRTHRFVQGFPTVL